MPTDLQTNYLLIALVLLLLIVGARLLIDQIGFLRPPSGHAAPIGALGPGWQFYDAATTLEPPGTVFRIDAERKRYLVGNLDVSPQVGTEVLGRQSDTITASMGVLARFFGLESIGLRFGAEKTDRIEFEMTNITREVVTDDAIDAILEAFRSTIQYRVDNRYFVIRDSRSATNVIFHLKQSTIDDLGGEASLRGGISAEGTLFKSRRTGEYELRQKFNEPMRIVFLPEEITTLTAPLAGEPPKLGIVPVEEALVWERGG